MKKYYYITLLLCLLFPSTILQAQEVIFAPSINGALEVTPAGAAVYTIPIECPDGILGLQPQISLMYNSQSGNGIAGWGWHINGLSAITRAGSTMFHDGKVADVRLSDDKDNLMLDGQRLILLPETQMLSTVEYKAEVENFLYIKKNVNVNNGSTIFTVTTKDGVCMEYGATANSCNYAPGTSTPMAWLLSRVYDGHGNYMTYSYEKNSSTGEIWLSSISYTGNDRGGIPPANKIVFEYEARQDVEYSYTAGKKFAHSKRLKYITSKRGEQTYRRYNCSYDDFDGMYSKLGVIKETVADGSAYLSNIVRWKDNQNDSYSKSANEKVINISPNIATHPVFADFNGDGVRDFVTIDELNKVSLFLNSTGNFFRKQCEFYVSADAQAKCIGIFPADLDGDGYMDLVSIIDAVSTFRYNFHFFDGSRFSTRIATAGVYYGFNEAKGKQSNSLFDDPFPINEALIYHVGDFNGDGRHEILIKRSQKVYNQYGNIVAQGGITNWDGGLAAPTYPNNFNLLNFTGSGKTNVCTRTSTSATVYELNSTNSTFTPVFTTNELSNIYTVNVGDYNGDGKTDIYAINLIPGNLDLYENFLLLSTGTSFEKKVLPKIAAVSSSIRYCKAFTGDFNLDGKTDFVIADDCLDNTSGEYRMRFMLGLCTGTKFDYQPVQTSTYAMTSSTDWAYLDIADYDGDGRSEICYTKNLNSWKIKSLNDPFFPRVASITGSNDMGSISLSYWSISSGRVHYPATDYATTFPVVKAFSPMYVVDTLRHNGRKLSYFYSHIRSHKQGKGFLGFAEVQTTDHTAQTQTTMEYGLRNYTCNVYPTLQTVKTLQGDYVSTTFYSHTFVSLGGVRTRLAASGYTFIDEINGLGSSYKLSSDAYGNPLCIETTKGNITETTNMRYVMKSPLLCPNKPDSVSVVRREGSETYSRSTTYEYNPKGVLIKEVRDPGDPMQVVTEYDSIDIFGRMRATRVTAGGVTRTSSLRYTPSGGFVASRTDVLGRTTTYQWDEGKGTLTFEKNVLGLTTSYMYDSFGRLREVNYPDGTKQVQEQRTARVGLRPVGTAKYYDYVQTPDSAISYTWFDALRREVCRQSINAHNQTIAVFTEYDDKGRLYRVSHPTDDPQWKTWSATYEYDELWRTKKVTTPRGNVEYRYSGWTTTVVAPQGTTETTINGAGQVATIKENGQAVSYTYYASGLTKTATPAGGQPISMKYDLHGNKVELTDPNAGTIRYTYDAFGQLLTQTNARSHTDSMRYDPAGRVTRRRSPEAVYTYGYNNYGLENVRRNGALEYAYRYDTYGRITGEDTYIEGSKYSYGYMYNAKGQLGTLYYPNNFAVNYGYRYGQTLSMGTGVASMWKLLEQNEYGQPVRYTWGNGQQTTLQYDNYQLLQSKTATGQLPAQAYRFNAAKGNLAERHLGVLQEYFDYDSYNRLYDWTHVDEQQREHISRASFLPNGNIDTKSDVGTYRYSPMRPHAVAGINDAHYGWYDHLSLSDQCIRYDSKNRPLYIAQGTDSLTFGYDHTGQRLYTKHYKKKVLHKTTHYVGGYEKEFGAAGTFTRCFVHAPTGLQAVREEACNPPLVEGQGKVSLLYVHTDHLGSIVALADANGAKLEEYSYDPWGRLRNPRTLKPYSFEAMPGLRLGRGFTGHEHLPEFGLINMNARLYDPLLGRFLNPDPYVQVPENSQSYNRYSYCLNNPLKYTDPTGEFLVVDAWIWGFLSKFVQTGSFKEAYHEGNRRGQIDIDLMAGLFKTDPNKSNGERAWELFSRFTWQFPQTFGGYFFNSGANTYFGAVSDVDYGYGMTVVDMGLNNSAVTIGNYTSGPKGYKADWRDHLFVHEYGHYIQSQQWGPFYLPLIGIPSIQSAIMYDPTNSGTPDHDNRWFEADASYKGMTYFDKYHGSGKSGYSANSPDYFDRNSFVGGTRSSYLNPRTGERNRSSNPIGGKFHWTDLAIYVPIPFGIGASLYYLLAF